MEEEYQEQAEEEQQVTTEEPPQDEPLDDPQDNDQPEPLEDEQPENDLGGGRETFDFDMYEPIYQDIETPAGTIRLLQELTLGDAIIFFALISLLVFQVFKWFISTIWK